MEYQGFSNVPRSEHSSGYMISLLNEVPEEGHTCVFCNFVLNDPVIVTCPRNHRMCRACLSAMRRRVSEEQLCHGCLDSIVTDAFTADNAANPRGYQEANRIEGSISIAGRPPDVIADDNLRGKIALFLAKCKYCTFTGQVGQVKRHVDEQGLVECKRCHMKVHKSARGDHHQDCVVVPCPYNCTQVGLNPLSVEVHKQVCVNRPFWCHLCKSDRIHTLEQCTAACLPNCNIPKREGETLVAHLSAREHRQAHILLVREFLHDRTAQLMTRDGAAHDPVEPQPEPVRIIESYPALEPYRFGVILYALTLSIVQLRRQVDAVHDPQPGDAPVGVGAYHGMVCGLCSAELHNHEQHVAACLTMCPLICCDDREVKFLMVEHLNNPQLESCHLASLMSILKHIKADQDQPIAAQLPVQQE